MKTYAILPLLFLFGCTTATELWEAQFLPSYKEFSHENQGLMDIALETKNISVCDEMIEIYGHDDCIICPTVERYDPYYKDKCYFEVAVSAGDTELCGYSTNWDKHEECHAKIAEQKQDPTLCENIEHPFWSGYCRANTRKPKTIEESSSCENKEGSEKDSCYFLFAQDELDHTLCGRIESDGFRERCYRDLARFANNFTICEEITNDSIKIDCYSHMCDRTHASSCIAEMAEKTGNEVLCGRLFYINAGVCYLKVAVAKENESICGPIEYPAQKDSCYYKVAVAKNDPEICEKIGNIPRRENCTSALVG